MEKMEVEKLCESILASLKVLDDAASQNSEFDINKEQTESLALREGVTRAALQEISTLPQRARMLRNACAGGESNIEYLQARGDLHVIVGDLCKGIAMKTWRFLENAENTITTETFSVSDHLKKTAIALCQFLANMTACSASSGEYLWSLQQSKGLFQHAVAAAVQCKSSAALGGLLAAIYNSTKKSRICLEILCLQETRPLCCQMLLAMVDVTWTSSQLQQQSQQQQQQQQQQRQQQQPQQQQKLVDNSHAEWFHLLGIFLCQRGCLAHFFSLVGRSSADQINTFGGGVATAQAESLNGIVKNEQRGLTHEQIIFLHIVRGIFEDRSCHDDVTACLEQDLRGSGSGKGGGDSDLWKLLHTLALALDEIDMEIIFSTQTQSCSGTFFDNVTVACLHMEVISGALSLLSKTQGESLRNSLASTTNIISQCYDILRLANPVSNSVKINHNNANANANDSANDSNDDKESCRESVENLRQFHNDLVKNALSLLGNLIYGSKVAQDTFGSRGCMAAVLSRCATDFNNPLAREWALLCIRNACDDHEQNQAFVQSLTIQGVVKDEELESHGINLSVQAGKLTFTRTKNDSEDGEGGGGGGGGGVDGSVE